MENKKYRITVLTAREILEKAGKFGNLPDEKGRLNLGHPTLFEKPHHKYCGETIEVFSYEKIEGYFHKESNLLFTREMLSCEPEPIEEKKVGGWVVSSEQVGTNKYGNFINKTEDYKKKSFVVTHTEEPLFPSKPTFISMEDISEFLKWKEDREQSKTECNVEVLDECVTVPYVGSEEPVYIWVAKVGNDMFLSSNEFNERFKGENYNVLSKPSVERFNYSVKVNISDKPIKIRIK